MTETWLPQLRSPRLAGLLSALPMEATLPQGDIRGSQAVTYMRRLMLFPELALTGTLIRAVDAGRGMWSR